VEYEPALLLSSEAMARSMPIIDKIYPDGFILINDSARTALLIDIDEDEGFHPDRIDLPA
jgi:hypothetical protein